MSLEGVLSDFGVGEIFQLIGQQRKTGTLEVKRGETAFEVGFVQGQVLRARPVDARPDGALISFLMRTGVIADTAVAEARREQEQTLDSIDEILIRQGVTSKEELEQISMLLTNETIFELFLWDEGRFAFRPADRLDERIGDRLRGAEGVLLDALRMKDEWSQLEDALPDFSGVPVLKVGVDELRAELEQVASAKGLDPDMLERLCRPVDGRMSLRRVLDLSRAGTFEAARGIAALIARDVLRVERPRAAEPKTSQASASGLALERWISFAPVLSLPLIAWLWIAPAPKLAELPIDPDPLGSTRVVLETQQIQAALEAFRWLEGKYPESLDELRASFASGLAAIPLARYSYERSRGGYRLAHESGRVARGIAGSEPVDPS